MERIYSSSPSTTKPIPLTPEIHADIGRLVRACAEIEDIITLRICALAGINPGQAVVLLGRTAVSRKLQIASYLSEAAGEWAAKITESAFTGLSEAIECRNAVAHGIYLGVADDGGDLVFLTANTIGPDDGSTMQVAVGYKPEVIKLFATALENAIPKIEERLQLSALRQTRLQQVLEPHRKGRTQQ